MISRATAPWVGVPPSKIPQWRPKQLGPANSRAIHMALDVATDTHAAFLLRTNGTKRGR